MKKSSIVVASALGVVLVMVVAFIVFVGSIV
jgi:hypothetical protein